MVNGSLGMALSRELQMTHDAMAVRYSTSKAADKLLVAVGLLDNTIKVFFDDSLKFFLSLYGHKLPGTTDIFLLTLALYTYTHIE